MHGAFYTNTSTGNVLTFVNTTAIAYQQNPEGPADFFTDMQ